MKSKQNNIPIIAVIVILAGIFGFGIYNSNLEPESVPPIVTPVTVTSTPIRDVPLPTPPADVDTPTPTVVSTPRPTYTPSPISTTYRPYVEPTAVRTPVSTSISQSSMLAVTDVGFAIGISLNPPVPYLTVNRIATGAIYHGTDPNEVAVYIYAKAKGEISKSVRLEIRYDYTVIPDSTFKTFIVPIEMKDEERWMYIGAFTPDKSTSSYIGLRQYFARVDINNDGSWDYNPTDTETRPHVLVN